MCLVIHVGGVPKISWSTIPRNPLKKVWRRGLPAGDYKSALDDLPDMGPARNIGEWTRGGPLQRVITSDEWQRELVKSGKLPPQHSMIMKDIQYVLDHTKNVPVRPTQPVVSLGMDIHRRWKRILSSS